MLYSESQRLSKYATAVNPLKGELLCRYLNPGSVLDIGCGSGLYSLFYKYNKEKILQIDLVDRRENSVKNIPFCVMDAENISDLDETFDNIIAFDLIEHLNDDIKFLKSLRQILSKNGKLFLSVPNIDNSELEKLNLAHIHFTDKTHIREYSPDNLKEKLIDAGFSIVELIPHFNSSLFSFPIILKKPTVISSCLAKFISAEIKILKAFKLFENRVIADWFCVAEIRR